MSVAVEDRRALLQVARHAIGFGLAHARAPEIDSDAYSEALRLHRASFVTLKLAGKLRGCMGTLNAYQSVVEDVCEHAFMAAFSDPRFSAVNATEAPLLDVSLSVLSERSRIDFASETDLLGKLRPLVDGLILIRGAQRATFLPAVWASLPEPKSFLEQLKRKASLSPDDHDYEAWRYTAESIS